MSAWMDWRGEVSRFGQNAGNDLKLPYTRDKIIWDQGIDS
jgi:hypothetical protein